MLHTILESIGATVANIPECSEARSWLRQATEEGSPFDLVLLDAQVPDTTRLGFIQSLKDDNLFATHESHSSHSVLVAG